MDNDFLNSQKVYTVLELNAQVRELIQLGFPNSIWICGEIQGLRPDRNKRHTYFELVQKEPLADSIVAKVKLALFAGRKHLIDSRIRETKGAFELKNDIEVKFLCEVSLHPPTGQYSLVIVDIDTVYTLGKVAQNRIKIIEDLKKRNLLEKNKLIPISDLPLKIGLITAGDSAAYHDFINELEVSGYAFRVLLYNAHMQGKKVETDVIKALGIFNNLSFDELDLIIITRGGGSTADLSYFDNKKIAEKIAFSKFPVVSAIGHQIDTTITDIVAHTYCKTPTKAAQFLVEKISIASESLYFLEEEIFKKSEEFLTDQRTVLRNCSINMETVTSRYFQIHREDILNKGYSILSSLKVTLAEQTQFIAQLPKNLKSILNNIFANYLMRLEDNSKRVKILDPVNTLRRGYSITLKGKKIIKSIDEVEEGDEVRSLLAAGSFISKVKKKEKANG